MLPDLHFFGWHAALDTVQGYEMVTNITSVLMHARQNEQEYNVVFEKMIAMVNEIK